MSNTFEIWALALLGWFGYNLIVFYIEKNKHDEENAPFNYNEFFLKHWDNWLFTLFFAIPMVYYGPDIHEALMHSLGLDFEWKDGFYAGPGVFAELLIWAYKKFRNNLKD
jgi:hypothetical protein